MNHKILQAVKNYRQYRLPDGVTGLLPGEKLVGKGDTCASLQGGCVDRDASI